MLIEFTVGNDTYNFNEDSTNNSLTVLDNDTIQSGSGAVLTFKAFRPGRAGGTITVVTGGKSINYTPAANFNGSKRLLTVVNQNGASAVGTVTVQVQPVNDPPVAVADSIEVTENTTENLCRCFRTTTMVLTMEKRCELQLSVPRPKVERSESGREATISFTPEVWLPRGRNLHVYHRR